MELHEYTRYDAVGLAGLVARGEVTAAELTSAARAATAAVNPRINAVVESWPAEDTPTPGSTPSPACRSSSRTWPCPCGASASSWAVASPPATWPGPTPS